MKKHWGVVAVLLSGFAGAAQASTLQDRGYWNASGAYSATAQGGYVHMVYEQDRNLTWLDVTGYGYMDWNTAVNWAANGAWGNRTDWRLPSVTDVDNDGYTTGGMYDAGGDWGYNLDTANGEMAHLFYDELGNQASYSTSGVWQSGGGLVNTGPFQNLQTDSYWSGTEYALTTLKAWSFSAFGGYQYAADKGDQILALAVRTGDFGAPPSAVPIPGAVWLFASALLGLTGAARRRLLPG